MKRLHRHLSVDDLAASMRFYSTLFAVEPAVAKPDNDRCMLDDPRVNFANSARSIMAESLLNALGQGRFRAYSGGSFPKGAIRSQALALLREQGLPTEALRCKPWDEFSAPGAPKLDFVFTLCDQAANEPCPVWPGQPITAHWGLPDPAAVEGSEAMVMLAYRDVFRMLDRRLRIFTSLPLRQLSHVAIQRKVDDIGRLRPDTVQGVAS